MIRRARRRIRRERPGTALDFVSIEEEPIAAAPTVEGSSGQRKSDGEAVVS